MSLLDVEETVEVLLSVSTKYHLTGVHKFQGVYKTVTRCSHEPYKGRLTFFGSSYVKRT